MFSLTKKTRKPEDALLSSLEEDNVARIAAREDGAIIYASESFQALCGGALSPEIHRNLKDFLNGSGPTDMRSLRAGPYRVTLPGVNAPVNFHFDWVTAPDERRYLVGSRVMEKTDSASVAPAQDLEQFFAMSPDIMLVTSSNHEILKTNGVFETLFNLPAGGAAVARLNFIDLFHAEDKPYIRNTIQTMNLENQYGPASCMDFEARIITPTGAQHWVEWRQCQCAGFVYYTGRDVTSIKAQGQALDNRVNQLQQAESIGRMGHWHWTLGTDSIEWSDELYRIFGVTKTFAPSLDTMSRLIHKRDIARVNQAFQRAIIEENDYDMEFRVLHPDGDVRYLRCEGRCATNDVGEVIALYGIMQDMTERMLYERDLKEAKEAAERANAAKSQFLANMSHELRTPLNAIIGFSEVILKQMLGPIGNAKYLEYMSGIHESGGHLLDLISDILDMSKMEAGKYELDIETVTITKTVQSAIHMMEGKALDAGVKIAAQGPMNEELAITADRRALLQVMLNLLSNAVKFTKTGGAVAVEMQERKDFVFIKVSDTGIGIPANKLASITKPFEQVFSHYTRDHEGSGLGLAITKELVEMHGGSLVIESLIDVGTTVTVKLPYKAKEKAKN